MSIKSIRKKIKRTYKNAIADIKYIIFSNLFKSVKVKKIGLYLITSTGKILAIIPNILQKKSSDNSYLMNYIGSPRKKPFIYPKKSNR